jgi:DNA-binding CsgD family transcriptional regulator
MVDFQPDFRNFRITALYLAGIFAIATLYVSVSVDSLTLASYAFAAAAAACALGAVSPGVSWLPPIALLLLAPLRLFGGYSVQLEHGCFAAAVLLMVQAGGLRAKRGAKLALLALYLAAVDGYYLVKVNGFTRAALAPAFLLAAFLGLLALALALHGRTARERAPVALDLAAAGLSDAERLYVGRLAGGLGLKEVASASGVSESTVRNTLSRAYRKLGVSGKAELLELLKDHAPLG